MPEERPVFQRAELLEALALAVPRDLEDLLDAQLVEVVRRGVRVLHVLLQRLELTRLAVKNLKWGRNVRFDCQFAECARMSCYPLNGP